MFFKDNITRYNGSGGPINILAEASETIGVYGRKIQEDAEGIIQACQIMTEVEEDTYRNILLVKANHMGRIAALYNSASERFLKAAEKLADGELEEKVVSQVFAYNIFLNDQIESEENEASQILSMLHKDYNDSCG
jgi:hypothetical protein